MQEELDEEIQALTGSDIRSDIPILEEDEIEAPGVDSEDSVESLIELWFNT